MIEKYRLISNHKNRKQVSKIVSFCYRSLQRAVNGFRHDYIFNDWNIIEKYRLISNHKNRKQVSKIVSFCYRSLQRAVNGFKHDYIFTLRTKLPGTTHSTLDCYPNYLTSPSNECDNQGSEGRCPCNWTVWNRTGNLEARGLKAELLMRCTVEP